MQKIVLSAKIKKCEIIEGKLEFEKLTLSSNECKQIKIWHDQGDPLQVVIEPSQGELFGEAAEQQTVEAQGKKKKKSA